MDRLAVSDGQAKMASVPAAFRAASRHSRGPAVKGAHAGSRRLPACDVTLVAVHHF
jgi:hypothetical protein